MSYFKHDTAIIDDGAQIGINTKVWHFSHVMTGAKIGKDCVLGQNVFIGENVQIGNGVKIQNNVSVFSGVQIEDDVFLGPSVVFTNVDSPRSFIEQKNYAKTLIQKGATIGANSTIVCGNGIGQYAFIGAGAVVTKGVPAFSKFYGVPAIHHRWISHAGFDLIFNQDGKASCPKTGENYMLVDGNVIPL
jgi:UDP-2-acetamido-3-amino-2,3-dideoxy-glucuronate N-acetyltransferase